MLVRTYGACNLVNVNDLRLISTLYDLENQFLSNIHECGLINHSIYWIYKDDIIRISICLLEVAIGRSDYTNT